MALAVLGGCAFDPAGVSLEADAVAPAELDAAPPPGPDAEPEPPDAAPEPDAPPPDELPDAAPPCPEPYVSGGLASCYLVVTSPTAGWRDAETRCVVDGAHLATIDDATENALLRASVPDGAPYWIGFNDRDSEGDFVWISGAPESYLAWADGEPNDWFWSEDCAMVRNDGSWNDASCADRLAYVCELVP